MQVLGEGGARSGWGPANLHFLIEGRIMALIEPARVPNPPAPPFELCGETHKAVADHEEMRELV